MLAVDGAKVEPVVARSTPSRRVHTQPPRWRDHGGLVRAYEPRVADPVGLPKVAVGEEATVRCRRAGLFRTRWLQFRSSSNLRPSSDDGPATEYQDEASRTDSRLRQGTQPVGPSGPRRYHRVPRTARPRPCRQRESPEGTTPNHRTRWPGARAPAACARACIPCSICDRGTTDACAATSCSKPPRRARG
jgi:hypothetical protein